ncbi:DNA-binding protein [Candidatus Pantoea deserta]|uniref:DNA-binding protein n=1 Tax=Candidatus Pantoea deserta TaxID=1869313 RepID=A0A3N4NKZ4_9GAMM|nr:helix-turn-helix domain-containing protein [Pantoea deserta]RPD96891.1 DNA-binding protein [Pantoea deserta]
MKSELMTLPEVARYLNVSPPRLVRAYCNQGTLEGVPLPEPLENRPFRQRYWSREEVRQFKHRLALLHHPV